MQSPIPPLPAAAALLPRDLDLTHLRQHVMRVRPSPPPPSTDAAATTDASSATAAASTEPLAYFPLSVLVHITEVAGAVSLHGGGPLSAAQANRARQEFAREASAMLVQRAATLGVPLFDLMRPAQGEWNDLLPGHVVPQHLSNDPEAMYITHRGFLECLRHWMIARPMLPGQVLTGNEGARLRKFVEHKEAIGEVLFGVKMQTPVPPPPQQPQTQLQPPQPALATLPSASPQPHMTPSSSPVPPLTHAYQTASASPTVPAPASNSTFLPPHLLSAAASLPPPPSGGSSASASSSLPPTGIPTIQAEIEAAESTSKTHDDEMSDAAPSSTVKRFTLPPDGLEVCMQRWDGKGVEEAQQPFVGKLVAIRDDLTIDSPMPTHQQRHPLQQELIRPVMKATANANSPTNTTTDATTPSDQSQADDVQVKKEGVEDGDATSDSSSTESIAEFFAARSLPYPPSDALRSHTSTQHIRIGEVRVDADADAGSGSSSSSVLVVPCDKMWRATPLPPNEDAPVLDQHAQLGRSLSTATPAPSATPSTPAAAPSLSLRAHLWSLVSDDPWDLSSWLELLRLSLSSRDPLQTREALRAFLAVYPSAVVQWKQLIELELSHRNYEEVERIFQLVLLKLPEVDLWKTYLVYTKLVQKARVQRVQDEWDERGSRSNSNSEEAKAAIDEATRSMNVAIETAYEFVLRHIGTDLFSGSIWRSYLNFMRGIPARSSTEEAAKTASLRKIFHRAIMTAVQPKELDAIWNEYEEWEHSIASSHANKLFSMKLLQEYGSKYHATRMLSRERRRRYQGIMSASVGTSYGASQAVSGDSVHIASRPTSSPIQQARDALQLQAWTRYLRFEQYGSTHFVKTDLVSHRLRVTLAFRQALIYLRHYPPIWMDYIKFITDLHAPPEEVRQAWKDFEDCLPYSPLPLLLKAESEEEAKRILEAKACYEKLIVPRRAAGEAPAPEHSFRIPTDVMQEMRKVKEWEKEREKKQQDKEQSAEQNKVESATATTTTTVKKEESNEESKSSEDDNESLVDIYKGELHRVHPLAFILAMRFTRRSEGVDRARRLFILARKSPSVTYHSYLYAAHVEHHLNNDLPKAQLIYTTGMKLFVGSGAAAAAGGGGGGGGGSATGTEGLQGPGSEDYLLAYLSFLRETNDHNNLRLTYGRLLLTESAESVERERMGMKKDTSTALMTKKQSSGSHSHTQQPKPSSSTTSSSSSSTTDSSSSSFCREATDDPSIHPDDWWAHINGLFPSTHASAAHSIRTLLSPEATALPEAEESAVLQKPPGVSLAAAREERMTSGSSSSSRLSAAAERAERAERSEPTPLPSPSLLSLWCSYVSFERDTATELSVILKAESKRDEKLCLRHYYKLVTLIDRWRFGDLWPCSREMRQVLEKMIRPDMSQLTEIIRLETLAHTERGRREAMKGWGLPEEGGETSTHATAARSRGILTNDPSVISHLKSSSIRPDLSVLTPFSSTAHITFDRAATRVKYGSSGSGSCPVPEQILNVLSVLPPAHLFQGPFVHPQLVLDMLAHVPTPERAQPQPQQQPPPQPHGQPQAMDTQSSAATTTTATGATAPAGEEAPSDSGRRSGGRKRKHGSDAAEEDEEKSAAAAAATVDADDLYRKRQMQKLAKQQE